MTLRQKLVTLACLTAVAVWLCGTALVMSGIG